MNKLNNGVTISSTSCHAGPNTLNKNSPTGLNVSISVRKTSPIIVSMSIASLTLNMKLSNTAPIASMIALVPSTLPFALSGNISSHIPFNQSTTGLRDSFKSDHAS